MVYSDSLARVASSDCTLRIFPVADRPDRVERAVALIEALAAKRPVAGNESGWTVTYPDLDVTEAFERCAEELSEIDPAWVEVLDFAALAPRPTHARKPRR